jgi:hypothetical protein
MDPEVTTPRQSNMRAYIIGAIVIIVVALLAWWFMGRGTTGGPAAVNTTQQNNSVSAPSSLKGLLAQTGSQKCTFADTGDASQSQGTVYVSNGKMRGDFTSVAGTQTIQSHMIVKDNTSYLWSDAMQGQGIKMSFDAMSGQGASTQGTPQAVDINAQVQYSCSAWSEDASQFALPTNITFQDVSAMMSPVPTASVKTRQ